MANKKSPPAAAPKQAVKPDTADTRAVPPSSSGQSWFSRNAKTAEQASKDSRNRRDPFRYWVKPKETMPDGSNPKIVILDNYDPKYMTGIWEHEMKGANGKFGTHEVCIQETEKTKICPLCTDTQSKPYWVVPLTVQDLRPFTTKKGEHRKFAKNLFMPKRRSEETLKRKMVQAGLTTTRGAVFEVYRTDEKTSRVGDDFTFKRQLTEAELKKLFGEDTQPFDYGEIFVPKTREQLDRMVGGTLAASSAKGSTVDDLGLENDSQESEVEPEPEPEVPEEEEEDAFANL